ncbi:MAG TPA: OmpA family protein [Rudaea sp.]|jgi:outer membrane protein OmpA-like peptidoglycan-associated protein|nr:OmpA family protein [Rudaea sp.]
MNRLAKLGLTAALTSLLGACATTPPGPPPEVVRLQNELNRLHNDPRIAPNAPNELRDADTLVSDLSANGRQLEPRDYQHRIYIADRLVMTAEASGLARYAEVRARDLGSERDRLMVDSRTHQLRDAQMAAADAQAAAVQAQQNAALAQQDAAASRAESAQLREDLSQLQAHQTQTGYVVTLGDVLFEVDRAELKPGATRTLDQLATALNDDPRSTISIEGHTDSTGSPQHNTNLSLARAESVKSYLVSRGVNPSRVTTQGLGQDYPVASNATEAGRQQNRRVEVVVQTNVASLSSIR